VPRPRSGHAAVGGVGGGGVADGTGDRRRRRRCLGVDGAGPPQQRHPIPDHPTHERWGRRRRQRRPWRRTIAPRILPHWVGDRGRLNGSTPLKSIVQRVGRARPTHSRVFSLTVDHTLFPSGCIRNRTPWPGSRPPPPAPSTAGEEEEARDGGVGPGAAPSGVPQGAHQSVLRRSHGLVAGVLVVCGATDPATGATGSRGGVRGSVLGLGGLVREFRHRTQFRCVRKSSSNIYVTSTQSGTQTEPRTIRSRVTFWSEGGLYEMRPGLAPCVDWGGCLRTIGLTDRRQRHRMNQ